MFFVFVLMILHFVNVNSFSLDRKIHRDGNTLTGNDKYLNFKDGARANASSFSTYKPFFGILQNINNTSTQNLKSNEFDKMLSEEMLAIKQLIYEKEKTTAPTPTLLVKERWQVMDLMSKLNKIGYPDEDDSDLHSSPIKANTTIEHTNLSKSLQDLVDENNNELDLEPSTTENVPKEKVIGLRSLYNDNEEQDPYKKCGCKKKQPKIECTKSTSTECTKSKTEYTISTTCPFHTSIETDISEEPSSTPSYVTTYTYTTCYPVYPSVNPNVYYSPYYVPYPLYVEQPEQPEEEPPRREKKIKKKRLKQSRHQTAKRHKNYDYYAETSTENTDDYLVNNYDKHQNNNMDNKMQQNDDIDKDSINSLDVILAADNCNEGGCTRGAYENERELFVNRVVNDLKNNYGDSAIKPCFCDRKNAAYSIHSGFIIFSCLFYLLV